jgi:acetyl esterase/lipase
MHTQGKGAHAPLTAGTTANTANRSSGESSYGDMQLCAQLFVYPVTDSSMSSASYIEFSDGPGLTKSRMGEFWRAYLKYPVVEGKRCALNYNTYGFASSFCQLR